MQNNIKTNKVKSNFNLTFYKKLSSNINNYNEDYKINEIYVYLQLKLKQKNIMKIKIKKKLKKVKLIELIILIKKLKK